MAKEVFFIADDFGASREINAAIIRAHLEGALHGAGLMIGQPGTEDAVRLAREHPSLLVGWHLHLNDAQPVTVRGWPWGDDAPGISLLFRPLALGIMRREVEVQWRLFCRTGLRCRFFSGHHSVHTLPLVYRQAIRVLTGGFKGWIRLGRTMRFDDALAGRRGRDSWLQLRRRHTCPFRVSDTLWGGDRACRMNAEEIAAVLPRLRRGRHEFVFHPRSVDDQDDTATLLRLRELI